ncbi:MAG: hypothetical protein K8I30_10095 [Anaerolineae bacterium]|nr:hypothetical protein [Anaerolineae bacterium]
MRVSIWQQFSSNHSSSFSVVGRFQSVEDAERVASRFRALFTAVVEWDAARRAAWDQAENEESDGQKRLARYHALFPDVLNDLHQPEREFSQQYGLDWKESIDWLWGEFDPLEMVSVVGQDVFVTTNSMTWHRPQSVIDAMILWGSGATVSEEGDERFLDVALTFHAPSEATAVQITEVVQALIDFDDEVDEPPPPPWMPDALLSDETDFSYSFFYDIVGSDDHIIRDGLSVRAKLRFWHTGYALPAFVAWLGRLGCSDIHYQLAETAG